MGYLGVVPFPPARRARSETPRLLYLGRLKRYKRIELLLDVLEGVPGAVLDIAGEGDHRPALEAAIAARGLGDRVVLHGHVSEEREGGAVRARVGEPDRLLGRGLVPDGDGGGDVRHAERGDPRSAGCRSRSSDGSTGLLADDGPGLTAAVQRLVADDELRERMGEAARARAATFTWERTARESARPAGRRPPRARRCGCARSPAARRRLKAAGMAAATMANNALALVFTVLFARILGATDYGSLAALVSTFVILSVPGSAVQVAVAREIALGRLGEGPRLAATLSIWRRRLAGRRRGRSRRAPCCCASRSRT